MTGSIAERPVDPNLQLVIDDVRALRRELQRGPDEAMAAHLTQLAAGYLIVNRPVLDLAFDAWRLTPEDELKQMFTQNRALDENAASHGFDSVGGHAIQKASEIMRKPWLGVFWINEDDLNMLLRILDYGKYLADCSGETVRWHPLPIADAGDRIDELRASLLAE